MNVVVDNSTAPPEGLVAAYAFDEGAGTSVRDESGNGHTGSIVGATWTANGREGAGISFNSGTDRVDLPALGTFYRAGFTYEAWVKKRTDKMDAALIGSWVSAQGGGAMIWVDHLAGRYRLTLGKSALADYLDSGRTPVVGQWQHVAATYDGAVARFYLDGVLVASRAFTGDFEAPNTWRIGTYGANPPGLFDGVIDEIRIYDRAISPAELQHDMVTGGVGPADTQAPSTPNPFSADRRRRHVDRDELGRVDRQRRRERVPALPRRPRGGDDGRDEPHVRGPPLRHQLRIRGRGLRRRRKRLGAGDPHEPRRTTATRRRPASRSRRRSPARRSPARSRSPRTRRTTTPSRASVLELDGRARRGGHDGAVRARLGHPHGRERAAHAPGDRARPPGNSATSAQVTVTVENRPRRPTGLVAAYGFDEGTGTAAADHSGNGNHRARSRARSGRSRRHGTAVSLDGSDDWVTVGLASARPHETA